MGLFFLLGMALGSIAAEREIWWLGLFGIALLIALLIWRVGRVHAVWVVGALLIGAGYAIFYSLHQKQIALPYDEPLIIFATVVRGDQTFDGQEVLVETTSGARIAIYTFRYPIFTMGDELNVRGRVRKSSSARHVGWMARPEIIVIHAADGWSWRRTLYAVRDRFRDGLERIMPYDQAALTAGVTMGGKSAFSPELLNQFRKAGLLHIVALSGANLVIVFEYIGFVLGLFLARRSRLWASILVMVVFVLMTGAESSLVRSALIASVGVIAETIGRRADERNGLIAVAALMTVFNPKVLVFDLGFQLSFLAVLGITYTTPWLERRLIRFNVWGKRAILITLGAEAATIPLLVATFGYFSSASVVANVLVELAVPVLMLFGFVAGGLALIAPIFGLPFGAMASILATYVLAVVHWVAGAR